jgi:hypothetical protein
MESNSEPRIKGISFIHFGEYLREKHGQQGLDRVLGAVDPSFRDLPIKAYGHEWYPLRALVECERKYVELFHGGDPRQTAAFGKYDAARQVGAIYRVILRHLSTAFLLKRGPLIWKSYMDRGVCAPRETGPNRVEIDLGGYDPIDQVHCHENVGSFESALEVCGASDARVEHVACRLDGAPACHYVATWR